MRKEQKTHSHGKEELNVNLKTLEKYMLYLSASIECQY